MRALRFLLAAAIIATAPTFALAQSAPQAANVVATCGTPNGGAYAAGTVKPLTQDTSGAACINDAGGGGTTSVNLAQVNGTTVTVGAGAGAAGTQRVTTSTDSTIGTVTAVTAITNALPAGSNVIGHVIADTGSTTAVTGNVTVVQPTGTNLHAVLDTTSTTAVTQGTAANLLAQVSNAGTFAVQATQSPSSASTGGVAPVQSASVETGHVIKGSAGNLYDFNVSADATLAAAQWEVLIFNSTTVPSSGAVTPVKCYIVPAGGTSVSGAFPTPLYLGTGISIAVSTAATCFTKTDSAHGFISADAQ